MFGKKVRLFGCLTIILLIVGFGIFSMFKTTPQGISDRDKMFVVEYQGSGLAGDDYGEFYRSDTNEWKSIYSNRKKLNNPESKLRSSNK